VVIAVVLSMVVDLIVFALLGFCSEKGRDDSTASGPRKKMKPASDPAFVSLVRNLISRCSTPAVPRYCSRDFMYQKILLVILVFLLFLLPNTIGYVYDLKVEFRNDSDKTIEFQCPQFFEYTSSCGGFESNDCYRKVWSKSKVQPGVAVEIEWREIGAREEAEDRDVLKESGKAIHRQTFFIAGNLRDVDTIRFVFTSDNGWRIVYVNE
jgi:hypothetical protein